jgi:hypothetical protein
LEKKLKINKTSSGGLSSINISSIVFFSINISLVGLSLVGFSSINVHTPTHIIIESTLWIIY